jgi:hypothetical protein
LLGRLGDCSELHARVARALPYFTIGALPHRAIEKDYRRSRSVTREGSIEPLVEILRIERVPGSMGDRRSTHSATFIPNRATEHWGNRRDGPR